ncbi:hypothetical protein HU200_059888 [Digitaria exilis]|uniref:Uncharacterized protein n=1 Tax=Digitaria exilis TaxID=1010633 RepID=A0A835AKI7_9POAL|nr:hypothetical protein HU200_059888 [Digitaria exilis]
MMPWRMSDGILLTSLPALHPTGPPSLSSAAALSLCPPPAKAALLVACCNVNTSLSLWTVA